MLQNVGTRKIHLLMFPYLRGAFFYSLNKHHILVVRFIPSSRDFTAVSHPLGGARIFPLRAKVACRQYIVK